MWMSAWVWGSARTRVWGEAPVTRSPCLPVRSTTRAQCPLTILSARAFDAVVGGMHGHAPTAHPPPIRHPPARISRSRTPRTSPQSPSALSTSPRPGRRGCGARDGGEFGPRAGG
ncbi:hypothetical protein DFH09DRAFT_1132572 [Mycena vulgaris]|nr:hypothetical protein DFH09DRAFT_1132572 [Mycena vulgaris]